MLKRKNETKLKVESHRKQDSPFCNGMQYLTSKGMQYLSSKSMHYAVLLLIKLYKFWPNKGVANVGIQKT